MSHGVLLEPCGGYAKARERARYWAALVVQFGIEQAYGIELRRERGAGWCVFLARQDGQPMPQTLRRTLVRKLR